MKVHKIKSDKDAQASQYSNAAFTIVARGSDIKKLFNAGGLIEAISKHGVANDARSDSSLILEPNEVCFSAWGGFFKELLGTGKLCNELQEAYKELAASPFSEAWVDKIPNFPNTEMIKRSQNLLPR